MMLKREMRVKILKNEIVRFSMGKISESEALENAEKYFPEKRSIFNRERHRSFTQIAGDIVFRKLGYIPYQQKY